MSGPFDPDDDPTQVAAAKAAAAGRDPQKDPLGEPDLIRAEAATIPGEPPVPRDAATLILYRLTSDGPRILMGCRSSGHDFMPDKYVFPGGRVDDEDACAPAISELQGEVDRQLRFKSSRLPRVFPLTAVREVFEETGLIVGKACSQLAGPPPAWTDYYSQGVAPCLDGFTFVGRAITPPMRHKRFDARFFMADADATLIDDRPPIDGRELNDLRWFTLAEVAQLDLPNVTRFVISEVEARLVRRESAKPFYLYWSKGGHVRERIG
jgi:8-oxo-dGTP pyrophosphatase MutT (NUDIX family)